MRVSGGNCKRGMESSNGWLNRLHTISLLRLNVQKEAIMELLRMNWRWKIRHFPRQQNFVGKKQHSTNLCHSNSRIKFLKILLVGCSLHLVDSIRGMQIGLNKQPPITTLRQKGNSSYIQ
ncbi:hypothetical protein V6Z11_A13G210600 [Gossypium hirsutum]